MIRTHSIALLVLVFCETIGIAMAAPLPLAPKTGSGTLSADGNKLGWFVGFVESGERCFAFAAAVQGDEASGAETRSLVETILLDLNLPNR